LSQALKTYLDDDDENFAKSRFDGLGCHMRLQLEKTYGGDDRFKLTDQFEVSFKDAETNCNLKF